MTKELKKSDEKAIDWTFFIYKQFLQLSDGNWLYLNCSKKAKQRKNETGKQTILHDLIFAEQTCKCITWLSLLPLDR